MVDILPFPATTGWCSTAGRHRWFPAWCEGAPEQRLVQTMGGVVPGAAFFWCDVCLAMGLSTLAPAESHADYWRIWQAARWRLFAHADGNASLRLTQPDAKPVEVVVQLSDEAARELAHQLCSAGTRGLERALELSGQDKWTARRIHGKVVLARMTPHRHVGLVVRKSTVRPSLRYLTRRCTACATDLIAGNDAEPQPVWRGCHEPPGDGLVPLAHSKTEAAEYLFCLSCVSALLRQDEVVLSALTPDGNGAP